MLFFSPDNLAAFTITVSLLALAPGPDNLYLLSLSVRQGHRAGLILVAGLCSGLLVHSLAVTLGLASLMAASTTAFALLKLLGAAYLLLLAWQLVRGSRPDVRTRAPKAGAALYRRGLLMNLGNPKVSLFYLALLPQFTQPELGHPSLQIAFLGLGATLITLVVFASLALLAESLGARLLGEGPGARALDYITAGLLSAFSLKLVLSSSEPL